MSAPSHTHVRIRSVVSLVVGTAAGFGMSGMLGVAGGSVAGWGVFALVNVIWVLLVVWRMDAAATRVHATREDPGRQVARWIALLGSVMSLVAVVLVVVQARHAPELEAALLAGIVVVSVVTSWALIQVDYLLRYARIYYQDPVGGIDFNQSEDPEYTDFIYFSVGLGLTYQVADTDVTSNQVRRLVIAQTLLAYLFGAVILATIINLLTSLG